MSILDFLSEVGVPIFGVVVMGFFAPMFEEESAADQGMGQALFVMDEFERETSLHAEVPVVEGLAGRRTAHPDDAVVLDVEVHLTADPAEIAGRPHLGFGLRELAE